MSSSLQYLASQKNLQPYHVDDNLLKLLIRLYSKNLIQRKLLTYKEEDESDMYGKSQSSSATATTNAQNARTNSKSPHKKLPKIEHDLIRVEYYNDFNSCLSLSQTISVLNSGNVDSALKLASSINNAAAAAAAVERTSVNVRSKSPKRVNLADQCQHECQLAAVKVPDRYIITFLLFLIKYLLYFFHFCIILLDHNCSMNIEYYLYSNLVEKDFSNYSNITFMFSLII